MTDNVFINGKVTDELAKELIAEAARARLNAYAPYSGFSVGAALMAEDISGEESSYRIITGCNVENASYPAGNCAERTALFKAVSEGLRRFYAIAIVAGMDEVEDYVSPCGICRQVLREFTAPDKFQVIMAKSEDDYIVKTLEELLPMSFGPGNLDK